MPKISDQKSVISYQNLKLFIREFLSYPRPACRTGRSLTPGPRGFTLIELLIVIAIIGILSTVILANYNSFGSRQEVKNAAEELKSELRKYQTFAISGQKDPTRVGVGFLCNDPGEELINYSVELDTGNRRYRGILNCTTQTAELPWVVLPDRFVITTPGCGTIQIRFLPIHHGVELECDGNPSNQVTIQLGSTNTTTTYNVNTSISGEIDVQQP